MSYFKNQPSKIVFGTATTEVTLTDSFNDTTDISNAGGFNLATVYVQYTPAVDSSVALVQFEAGADDANFFPKTALVDENASGESTSVNHIFRLEAVTAGVTIKKRFLIELADIKLRISAKETTLGAYGSIKIILIRNEQ